MGFARSHGADIYYERHGQGPAVLFCHGAGSNAATWWQQIPVFSRYFTCLTYDHRCFGRSAAPGGTLAPACLVDDALAILDAECIGQAALVCQSLGGVTGLRLAVQHPSRVWAFVPCDSPLGIDHAAMRTRVSRHLQTADATRLEDRALGRPFTATQAALTFLYAQINGFNPMTFAQPAERTAWRDQLGALLAPPCLLAMDQLGRIACPTLFVVGSDDPLVAPDVVRDVARHVPGSTVMEIGGAGHSPYFEQPDVFNARVLAFLHACAPA